MEEKLHRRWVKIGGKKGSIFDGNFQFVVGGMLFEEIMGELGEEKKNPQEICKNIMTDVMKEIADETYALRAIKQIYSWIDTKNKYFLDNCTCIEGMERPPSDIYGKFNGLLTIDIYTKPLKEDLKKFGFVYIRVIKDFEELKWINKANDQIYTSEAGNGRGISLDCEKIYKDTKMTSPYLRPDMAKTGNKDFEPIKNGEILKLKVTDLSTFATDV